MSAESVARVLALPELRRLALRCDGELTGSAQVISRVEHVRLDVAGCPPALIASIATSSLRVLDLGRILWNSQVGDAHLGLEHPPSLAKLELANTKIGPSDLAIVATLSNLQSLGLMRTQIRDADLAALLPLPPTLRHLDVDVCRISKIDVLRQFHALESLDLLNSFTDKASFAELRRALPSCKIAGEGWEPDA